MDILGDSSYTVVPVPAASSGVAWLRAHVARFCEGPDHVRRRALAERALTAVDPALLRRPGAPVATLAAALGLPRGAALVADVRRVAACYQPHVPTSPEADAAVARLVDGCGGTWDERTAALLGLLVQACDATLALAAGRVPPVPATRRVGPDGQEVVVDLGAAPFGAGRHACPGREHGVALADGVRWFRRLHDGPAPLVLPNAWDVASALALVEAGFPAVGTTSLGVAAGHGLADGTGAAREATLALVRRLTGLPVPVTVDVEHGFGDDPAELAAELSALGVAGVNVEDGRGRGLAGADEQAALLAGFKRGAPELFVNARVDTHWLGTALPETLPRALRYVDAGADGVFVPGLTDPAAVERLATALPVPLNVLAGPPLRDLAALGVRRVSTGSLLYRTALRAAVRVAEQVRDGAAPAADALPYEHVERLVTRQHVGTRDAS